MTSRTRRSARVLFVLRSGGGGSLINVLLLVRYLDQERFRPTVLFYDSNPYVDDFREAGADVRVLDSSVSVRSMSKLVPHGLRPSRSEHRVLRMARRVNRFVQRDCPVSLRIATVIRDVEADLVQSNICPSADRASILAAGLARVPHVSYSQYFTADEPWFDRPLSVFADRYLCISEAVRRQVIQGVRVREDKTRLVFAPFEFPAAAGSAEAAARVRTELKLNGRHKLIANVGRLVPWKGQDIFLRAFAAIAEDHPDAHALVVGSPGDNRAGVAYEAQLRDLVSELGLTGRVTLTGHRTDIEDIMSASDVVVHSSSQAEPLGRVIMEAIALEKPVIATDGGGVPEMVRDGSSGSLVPPGDERSMAVALRSVLDDPERAAKMAATARQQARRRFSARTFVQTLESEYDRILGI
ncbi:MAG: glycosyltransferase [Candidatus Palauibacterales bacterium]|nr:glycosyltransferase [Candidatus Palauibacterales bacterium]MDP2481974.1 glycosyltransferase [Candidatus Palauibacterales bacterium]